MNFAVVARHSFIPQSLPSTALGIATIFMLPCQQFRAFFEKP
jgi:hypothetical protein